MLIDIQRTQRLRPARLLGGMGGRADDELRGEQPGLIDGQVVLAEVYPSALTARAMSRRSLMISNAFACGG